MKTKIQCLTRLQKLQRDVIRLNDKSKNPDRWLSIEITVYNSNISYYVHEWCDCEITNMISGSITFYSHNHIEDCVIDEAVEEITSKIKEYE